MQQHRPDVAYLRAGGTSLAIDLGGPAPAVLHWGADLGPLSDAGIAAIKGTAGSAELNNAPDVPRVLTLWPTEADSWTGAPAIEGHRNGVDTTPRPTLVHASVELCAAGSGTAGSARGTGGTITLDLHDAISRLGIHATYRLTPEGLLEVASTITVDDDADGVYDLTAVTAMLPVPARATEILDLTGKWCRERSPQRQPVRDGSHTRTVRRGKPGVDSPYLMMVGTPGFGFRHGELWGMHVAFSGDQRWFVERVAEGAGEFQAVVGGGEFLRPGEIRLAAGESYAAPTVVFGWSDHGTDGLADRFHDHLRARATHPTSPRPLVLNTWEAVYFDHDLDRLTALTDRAATIGVERIVLDDGWFAGRRSDQSGLGDWTVDTGVWPDGLHPLVDRIREHGMQFGLWFEPEMVSLDSEVARTHPEWLLAPSTGVGLPSRSQYVLDIAIPECWEHVLGQISSLVGEYAIDYLKWDHNRDLNEAVIRGGASGTVGDRPGVHAQTLAFYALIDALKDRHPGLEIETCSAGGGRIDLGVLARTDRVWASDCNDPIERQAIQTWTSLLLPPELVGTHVGAPRSHTTARVSDDSFRLATTLFGHSGIEWDITSCTEAELELLRAWAAMYREFRDLIHTGRTVHADVADPSTMLHGSVSQDGGRALFSWVRLATSGMAQVGRVPFPGLDPEREYRVRVREDLGKASLHQSGGPAWFDAAREGWFTVPGFVLTTMGLPLPNLNPGQALLLEFDLA
ncbi:alpha-galactosidase [Plantibacter sp. YIM 135347]|uniref:alpha-galactosidase n=1 Tax=Plantibacter sp. YIM 135347 TaxID=3423919 RepID=UPI003D34CA45